MAVVTSTFRPILPVVLAQAGGAFRRAGLQVTVTPARSSDHQLSQLADGAAHVAHTALDNVVAWSATKPVRVIALVDLGVAHELIARDPIVAVQRLRGAVIGIDSPANGLVVLLRAVLREAGLEEGDYELRAAGGLLTRARAFEAGELDACLLAGAALERARMAGHHRLLALRERFPRYPALAVVARHPTSGHRRQALARYVGALHAATRTAEDSPATLAAVARTLGTTVEDAAAWLGAERARMTGLVSDPGEALQTIADALEETGRILPGEQVDRFVDLLMEPLQVYTVFGTRRGNG